MNIKRQSRLSVEKQASMLQKNDMFQYIADDVITCRVISRDHTYVRYKVMQWGQTFTTRHYEIANARGFKYLGKYSFILRVLTFGKKAFKAVKNDR